MGRTLKIIADRADDDSVTVVPQETGAPEIRVEAPPGALALKVLHLMYAEAGVSLAEDMEHGFDQAVIRRQIGIRNLSIGDARKVLRELARMGIEMEDLDASGSGELRVGNLFDYAFVRFVDGIAQRLAWKFGTVFRNLVAESDRWSLIDRAVLLQMRSRYSIALFEHLSGLSWRTYRSQRLSLERLRLVLGVPEGRLRSFADLRVRSLEPAIREINALSRFDVGYEIEGRRGRGGRVRGVEIFWDLKAIVRGVQEELELLPVADGIRNGVAKRDRVKRGRARFPGDGSVRWDSYWEPLARDYGQGRDVDWLGQEFVKFCERRGIPLDAATITKTFVGFCGRQDAV